MKENERKSGTKEDLIDPLVLNEDQRAFFKSATRITEDDALELHVSQIRDKGYLTFPYPCISSYNFLSFRASNHPLYLRTLALKDRENAIFLDQACCFGTDIRKAVSDGWPSSQVVGSDLRPEF
ncbi:hypothetical protein BT69DRAFT_1234423, partial [Atractiella rhizophila]